jgi:L-fucose isomerase-like protein
MQQPKPVIAFIGFGEVNSPRDLIEAKCATARDQLAAQGVDVVYVEPVSDDAAGRDVQRAQEALRQAHVDCIVLCVAGWIPSHAVVDTIIDWKHVPVVLWGLCGQTENGRLVTTADQAGTSALRQPLVDLGFNLRYVYERPDKSSRASQVASFARAAQAARHLRHSRVGLMGFRDMRLYGTLYDGVSLRRVVGPDVEAFEMLEMVQRAEKASTADVNETLDYIKRSWTFAKPAPQEALAQGARYYCGLAEKVRERHYDAVSLIDVDGMKKLLGFPPGILMALLADRLGVCTIPENDTLGAVTQLCVRYLTGQAGAYLEHYEFMDDRLLMGVPDYVPAEVVDGGVTILPSTFGTLGQSMLNVSRLKTGRVTLCRLSSSGDRYRMHVVSGEAKQPRRWEEAGWQPPAPQLPGLEVVLDSPVEEFAQKVMGQHYIVSYGDNGSIIGDLCRILGVEVV